MGCVSNENTEVNLAGGSKMYPQGYSTGQGDKVG